MLTTRRTSLLAAVALAFALLLAGCGDDDDTSSDTTTSTAGATTSTTKADTSTTGGSSSEPACTEDAVTKAIDASDEGPVVSIDEFDCADGWGYAFATVGGGSASNATTVPEISVTVLLEAKDGAWSVVDRATPCEGDEVPEAIRSKACDSN